MSHASRKSSRRNRLIARQRFPYLSVSLTACDRMQLTGAISMAIMPRLMGELKRKGALVPIFYGRPYVIGQTIIFLPCDFYLSFFFFLA